MAKILTIGAESFKYPENKDSPGWGAEASAWAEAVTDLLNGISSPNDILLTSAPINNNVTSATSIPGLALDYRTTRGAKVEYCIYRKWTSGGTQEKVETGTIYAMHKDGNSPSSWELAQTTTGGLSGVTFSITGNGQFQYVSTDVGGSGHSGYIKFKAYVFNNT